MQIAKAEGSLTGTRCTVILPLNYPYFKHNLPYITYHYTCVLHTITVTGKTYNYGFDT